MMPREIGRRGQRSYHRILDKLFNAQTKLRRCAEIAVAIAWYDQQPRVRELRILPACILQSTQQRKELRDVPRRMASWSAKAQHHRHFELTNLRRPIIVLSHQCNHLVEEARKTLRLRPGMRRNSDRSLHQTGVVIRVNGPSMPFEAQLRSPYASLIMVEAAIRE